MIAVEVIGIFHCTLGGSKMNEMNHMDSIINKIYVEKIQVKEIIFEYRGSKDTCLHRCIGDPGVHLSPAYFKRVENYFISLEEQLFKFFITLAYETVKVKVPVNDSGEFDFDSLSIEITTTVKDNKGLVNKVNKLSKTLMGYAELFHELRIHGNQGDITHLTAMLVTSLDELLYIAEQPIIHPDLKKDWAQVIRKAQDESKRTYNYERLLPCIDGTLEWDSAEICLQIHQSSYLAKGGIAK